MDLPADIGRRRQSDKRQCYSQQSHRMSRGRSFRRWPGLGCHKSSSLTTDLPHRSRYRCPTVPRHPTLRQLRIVEPYLTFSLSYRRPYTCSTKPLCRVCMHRYGSSFLLPLSDYIKYRSLELIITPGISKEVRTGFISN